MTSSKYSLASEMFKFSPFHYCTRMRARTHTHTNIYIQYIYYTFTFQMLMKAYFSI